MNSKFSLGSAIVEMGLSHSADTARQEALISSLSMENIPSTVSLISLVRHGYVFEIEAISEFKLRGSKRQETHQYTSFKELFNSAMSCWWVASGEIGASSLNTIEANITKELGFDLLPLNLNVAFRLAVAGLVSEKSAEIRLYLKKFTLDHDECSDWSSKVMAGIAKSFILLVRKGGGWGDIDRALFEINLLREAQKNYEDNFIESQGSQEDQARIAMQLLGFYNLAQIVTSVAEYFKEGNSGHSEITYRLDRLHRQSTDAFKLAGEYNYTHFADLLWCGCKELLRNSLWSHIEALPDNVRNFGRSLILGRPNPVLELWPSQQEALRKSLLDTYQRAILVEMPTSAGKTLLAKFAIVQTKALTADGVIAYIVPTRALVNQITFELRQDFSPLKYKVELAIPVFELDPTESKLLSGQVDILVTTPEKLDLLLRSNHPVVSNLVLVIADEAHNLQEAGRGARLELLLGTIKREKRNTRFLLLSPFLPNGQELVTWLGDDRALAPIKVNWRPSNKIVTAVLPLGTKLKRRLFLETLPSIDNAVITAGTQIPIGNRDEIPSPLTIKSLSIATARILKDRGGILILCKGKGTAMQRAKEIARLLPEITSSSLLNSVCEFVTAEAGYENGLVECLKKGVAYHHAGLSQETRWLIESLIRKGEVQIICGTTTLAQGVNFPISTVIMETLKKGNESLTYSDFWNIAGRAGRALVDTLGLIAFPTPDKNKKNEYTTFLKSEAKEISSQLASLLMASETITEKFDLKSLRDWPQLSALLQFLAHAVRVSSKNDIADEMEDLLRSSLVYHQASNKNEENLNKFINLCRSYVNEISPKKNMLALADATGFATPTVFYLIAQTHDDKSIKDPSSWTPDTLFSSKNDSLKKRVELIGSLPEMHLGDGSIGNFDPERVANIIKDWVKGDSLLNLTERYTLDKSEQDLDKKVSQFSSYLFSTLLANASWGLGALEGLCLSGRTPTDENNEVHIPSMVYFGVQTQEAVWLRMAGIPRMIAETASTLWKKQGKKSPESFTELRDWITNFTDSEWASVTPQGSRITSQSMKIVWKELSGI